MSLLSSYGILGSLRLFRDVLITKLFFRRSRIIRHPYYIRGFEHIDFGRNLTTGVNLRIDAFPNLNSNTGIVLQFGDNVELNDYVHIAAVERVLIGNNVLIASKVFITDHGHGSYSGENQSDPEVPPTRLQRPLISKPVVIEDNVWLGEYVTILPGVTIGRGTVVGAMSVVTKDIPAGSIAVGSPARVIKTFNKETRVWDNV
jgi:acetyltransferase-like isoleucine patch superfamily enzyme